MMAMSSELKQVSLVLHLPIHSCLLIQTLKYVLCFMGSASHQLGSVTAIKRHAAKKIMQYCRSLPPFSYSRGCHVLWQHHAQLHWLQRRSEPARVRTGMMGWGHSWAEDFTCAARIWKVLLFLLCTKGRRGAVSQPRFCMVHPWPQRTHGRGGCRAGSSRSQHRDLL